ncbi:MAG: dihydroorotate dehydrogenase [Oscillospiraceae bacterium]|jgi:dihydroorotate dehydrogenase (NAD+) catalytic subunit|nr:dihydroorotate dehydrogenase [Oscillospiraceae bacterium]
MLKTNICNIEFKNPVIAASGTFGYGREYSEMYDLSFLGGISTKGTTLLPREGNSAPRIAETPCGMLNSVGLQNPGADKFLETELPFLKTFDTVIIANVAGSTVADYAAIVEKLENSNIDMLEVNISCPNVKEGGVAFGTNPKVAAEVTKAVREKTKKPVIMKLSPNVTDITEIAKACESEGADCISLINTLLGMRIDLKTRKPILYNNMGGFSGEAIFPVAVRMVYQVANAVKLPVIGMGGINSGKAAIEMLMAGAVAVQIGTAIITDPYAPLRIIKEIEEYLTQNNLTLKEIVGSVKLN